VLGDPGFFCLVFVFFFPPGNNADQFLACGFQQYFSVMSISVELEKPVGPYMVQGNELADSPGN